MIPGDLAACPPEDTHMARAKSPWLLAASCSRALLFGATRAERTPPAPPRGRRCAGRSGCSPCSLRGRDRRVGRRLHLPQRRGGRPLHHPGIARRRRRPDRLRRRRPARRLRHRRRLLRRPGQEADHAAIPCRLYRNLGDWQVPRRDRRGRPGPASTWFYTHGCAVADYDRDGWPDLLVTGYGRLALFHNEPDGKGGRQVRGRDRSRPGCTDVAGAPAPPGPTSTATATPTCTSATTSIGRSTNNPPCTGDVARCPATSARRSTSTACRTRCTATTATARSPT